MNQALVSIHDLTVTLGGKPILCGVHTDIERGKITALIGLNGAGKTTLLRALIKEVPYQGTAVFHCGHDHSKPTPEHIGYVPQKLRIDGTLVLTVLDLFGLCLRQRPLFLGLGKRFHARVVGLLEKVGAAHLVDQAVDKLSGGELQRVLLSLALEPQPELLLLDEPAAGIDFQMQQGFYDLISQLNAQTGVTVLLVSHDVSLMPRVAHQVLCMKDGRIECSGAPQAILSGDTLARIFGPGLGVHFHQH
jgi:zinc transport system ATP-binding protein